MSLFKPHIGFANMLFVTSLNAVKADLDNHMHTHVLTLASCFLAALQGSKSLRKAHRTMKKKIRKNKREVGFSDFVLK